MVHYMDPTEVFVLILLGIFFDLLTVGPVWLHDRIAFVCYLAGFYEGFNGSAIDAWTFDRLKGFVQWALDRTGDAYIAGAIPAVIIGTLIFGLWVYAIACFVPQRFSSRLGRVATAFFPHSGMWAINYRLLGVAAGLALMGDVPAGWMGDITSGTNDLAASMVAPIVSALIGG